MFLHIDLEVANNIQKRSTGCEGKQEKYPFEMSQLKRDLPVFSHFNLDSMEIQVWPLTIGVAACVLLAAVICLRRALLPKPISGIPYNKAAANRILGDAPDVSYCYPLQYLNSL